MTGLEVRYRDLKTGNQGLGKTDVGELRIIWSLLIRGMKWELDRSQILENNKDKHGM